MLLDSEDSSIAQVRDHIESLVESLVGKNLDEAKVIQLFDHPSCKLNTFVVRIPKIIINKKMRTLYLKRLYMINNVPFSDNELFTKYHGRLKESLVHLSKAIYAVIRSKYTF